MSRLRFDTGNGGSIEVEPSRLVIAGWTGRDRAAIEHHIEELARLGVPRPSSTPLYYRVSRSLLTQAEEVEMLGGASSGEAEPVLIRHDGRWWLTVGSDHTDRSVETYSVAVSKQMCAKPVARVAWTWPDSSDGMANATDPATRFDNVILRSAILEDGCWVTYQEGPLARILPLQVLVDGLPADIEVAEGLVLFCGTHGAIPSAKGVGIRPAPRMRIELVDATASRRITHEYHVGQLPVVA